MKEGTPGQPGGDGEWFCCFSDQNEVVNCKLRVVGEMSDLLEGTVPAAIEVQAFGTLIEDKTTTTDVCSGGRTGHKVGACDARSGDIVAKFRARDHKLVVAAEKVDDIDE